MRPRVLHDVVDQGQAVNREPHRAQRLQPRKKRTVLVIKTTEERIIGF